MKQESHGFSRGEVQEDLPRFTSLYATVDEKVFESVFNIERANAHVTVGFFHKVHRKHPMVPISCLARFLKRSSDAVTRTVAAEVADQGKHPWIPGSC